MTRRIVGAYVLAASLWICLSDQLLQWMAPGDTLEGLTHLQTVKGLLFVALSGGLLWILISRRIKQMRRAETDRSTSEDRLETFADNLPGLAYIKDEEGRFVFLRGRTPDGSPPSTDVIGHTGSHWYPPATHERQRMHDREVVQSGKGSQLVESVEVGEQAVHFLVHRFPLAGPNGQKWMGGIALDISERQRAEDRIRELARELESASRLKDQFLSNLSHELRTPITAIRLWTDVLKSSRHEQSQSVREAIEMIEISAVAQTQLIEDLLDVTRIIAGKLRIDSKPVNFASVVAKAIALLEPLAAERRVTLELQSANTSKVMVRGDERRLQQIVWNLLSNAIKFSAVRQTVVATLEAEGNQWVLKVKDQGVGIGKDLLPHLFERFRQGETSRVRSEGGVGIGLSIVRHLAEAHGGTATAASEGEGLGATFTVRLPALIDFDAASPAASLPSPAQPLAGYRILLVEDNSDSRTALTLLFRRFGAEVTPAEECEAAMGLGDNFDVLLSDIGLPDHDGCYLMEQLRSRPQWIGKPAVAISAYAMPEDRARALSAGFDAFVVKPLDPDGLVELIQGLIVRKRSERSHNAPDRSHTP